MHNKDKVICCPEQIAYYKNWISKEQLQERAKVLRKNTYGEYLQKIIDENFSNSEVEWITDDRKAVVPFGLLIAFFEKCVYNLGNYKGKGVE